MKEYRPLSVLSFILDRLIYIAVFYAAWIFVVAVIWLDMLGRGRNTVHVGNIVYAFILATAALAFGLGFDYVRQRKYFRTLEQVYTAPQASDLQAIIGMDKGVTGEQQFMNAVLMDQYQVYMQQLRKYRMAQEQHNHFTNQWVHHMKTPVSVIDLHIQESNGLKLDPEAKAAFHSISEENDRIKQGLEMMLHMARLDKFEFDLHVRQVDLPALARQVVNDHKKACIRWSIFPKVESSKEHMKVETDEKWMTFILQQLVTNAIKYSKKKPGTKQLTIQIEQSEDGRKTQVRVIDTGIGIAAHDLPRVYDPFFTGENGRKGSESTGMGLFLVREVIQKLGHRIEITSQEGEGTAVTIHFYSGALHYDLQM